MTNRYLFFSLAAMAVATQACNSTSNPPALTDPNTALLAAHPWHIVAYTSTDNTVSPAKTEDSYSQFSAYRIDDTY
jgi:hypothetical protein